MAEPKTRPTGKSVAAFIAALPDPEARKDSRTLVRLMKQYTGAAPRMWGPSIIGFGTWTVRYASGKELDWPEIGFSPRKGKLSLYLMGDVLRRAGLLRRLGKHGTSKACLYIRRLADVDPSALEDLIAASVASSRSRQPGRD